MLELPLTGHRAQHSRDAHIGRRPVRIAETKDSCRRNMDLGLGNLGRDIRVSETVIT